MIIETRFFRNREKHTDYRVVIVRLRRRPWRLRLPRRGASLWSGYEHLFAEAA